MPSEKPKDRVPPLVITHHRNGVNYQRKNLLGRGGFAKCYELVDTKSNIMYAGKVVLKAGLQKPQQKEKMKQEISIHRSLKHENIVEFITYFDDQYFVYVVLEMCSKKTLMELHKRRGVITEPETRYFIKQIVNGCQYLHNLNIIHRDLKLANLFLNSELIVKIGDFGLATTVKDKNDKKTTMCGTPNYIAPEILLKSGHRFEVDIWSLGCILYTFLVGKPPFETQDLKETYELIKSNSYKIPSFLSQKASVLISSLLHDDPANRPTMFNVLDSPFFEEFTPESLPESVLTTAPRFDQLRVPLSSINNVSSPKKFLKEKQDIDFSNIASNLVSLKDQLESLTSTVQVSSNPDVLFDCEYPLSAPIFWISRWVDYSDKYGLGYELCDNSSGVLFNDETILLMTKDKHNLQYIDSFGKEMLYTINEHPEFLAKRIELLTSFKNYMLENLLKTGNHINRKDSDSMARLPFLVSWMRADKAIVFFLSNGTTQINFFGDHFKLIMCPLLSAITTINENQEFRTYPIKYLKSNGITPKLHERINYSITTIESLQRKLDGLVKNRCSPAKKKRVQ